MKRIPTGSVRIVDSNGRGLTQRVEVWMDGEVLCQLPATEVDWLMRAGELSKVRVTTIAHETTIVTEGQLLP